MQRAFRFVSESNYKFLSDLFGALHSANQISLTTMHPTVGSLAVSLAISAMDAPTIFTLKGKLCRF
ncbi:hypothetical protein HMPREF2128_04490 [Pseudoglutamicibacter albus DNF00011]|uniref:Uncharacterized protein n=1 Tax=Pseudoglutamicibacter albus DNF00011 TaxID=1401063 RepID=A0A096AI74_9MICC|nr:hypothetical protein HMPREF2128_04490 [Pseudoglutamicibacter albus DNF00011]